MWVIGSPQGFGRGLQMFYSVLGGVIAGLALFARGGVLRRRASHR